MFLTFNVLYLHYPLSERAGGALGRLPFLAVALNCKIEDVVEHAK
jgi:hypothetical protein